MARLGREERDEKKENLLANTLFPRLSKMCSDLQKSRPPAGHGVSIAHSLHICEQKERGGRKKKIGTVSSGFAKRLLVIGEPIDRRTKLSIVFQSLIRYQGESRGKEKRKKYGKEFADSRRSNIWITDGNEIERREGEKGGGCSFDRTFAAKVKSCTLRACL